MSNDIRINVPASPQPGLLRPAIEAALAGAPWREGVEAQIGAVVAEAVRSSAEGEVV